MTATFTCPVCGFGMEHEPHDYNICDCCGTEFDNHDANCTHAELRENWIRGGMKWWYTPEGPPKKWSPEGQLLRLLVMTSSGRLPFRWED